MIFKIVAKPFPERGGIQDKFLQHMAFNSVCFLDKLRGVGSVLWSYFQLSDTNEVHGIPL
jgi:hypothetical protein